MQVRQGFMHGAAFIVGSAVWLASWDCSLVAHAASTTPVATVAPELLKAPARDWVVDASNLEIKAIYHEGSYLRYLVSSKDRKGERVRDTIETKDGSVARLIRRDGRPLTPDEDQAERERLQALQASPSAFARHQKDEDESRKLAVDLIRLLPDAMTFAYVSGQPQTPDASGPEVVIDYTPKPGWNPPTTISAGLKGLRGRAWIDSRTHYVVRLEGEIFEPVNFGWGMLAHIYPGGKLAINQRAVRSEQDTARERWIYTTFSADLRVRAVMVKTVAVQSEAETSHYQLLPGAPTYQDAISTLLQTPLPGK